MVRGGRGWGVFPLRRPDDPAPPPALPLHTSPLAQLEKCPPDNPPLNSVLVPDDNCVSARGEDTAERYRQVPQVALSANLPQRSLGLFIPPSHHHFLAPPPHFLSPSQHFRCLQATQPRELLPRSRNAPFFPPRASDNRKRRGDALAFNLVQGGRA